MLLPEPMTIGKVYAVGEGGNATPTDAAFPLEAGREEKGLQFDLEKEAWRFTFERAKPNAMRLRIEVYPKSSATASQVLSALADRARATRARVRANPNPYSSPSPNPRPNSDPDPNSRCSSRSPTPRAQIEPV